MLINVNIVTATFQSVSIRLTSENLVDYSNVAYSTDTDVPVHAHCIDTAAKAVSFTPRYKELVKNEATKILTIAKAFEKQDKGAAEAFN